jgi:2-polyprenyl-6-methoxyphenol hydroxylase-like FAD-dependent oxidoreductase
MCSAAVLRAFYDEVVIYDRDRMPVVVDHRAGVPQSRHAHALLLRGQQELEALFPGFVDEMCAAGALKFDSGTGFAFRREPGWQDVGSNGMETLWSSRILLEFTVRSLLLQQRGIELREGCHVTALIGGNNGSRRVTGVKVRADGGGEQTLGADIVVDASGRNTHADEWLRALHVVTPEAQRVDAQLGYASRFYRAPAKDKRPADWWWAGLWIDGEAKAPRAGVIFPIEGDRWMVTVAAAGTHPPTDEAGFKAFMESLSSPSLARAVALAEPISAIHGNRSTANVFRRYDRWNERLPGFIALGDAVCAFNPIYGQGMSTAAACAGILRDALRSKMNGLAFEPAFFRMQAAFLKTPWELATSVDFLSPTTEGQRPRSLPLVGKYLGWALESAHFESALRRHIIPIFHLTGSPARFFEPRFVLKVLARTAQRRLGTWLRGPTSIPDWPPALAAAQASARRFGAWTPPPATMPAAGRAVDSTWD